ncbi:hypothetical protein PINS_up000210 [Pythium insidiosum]|nr:hypothetical protein PINS_up000210 [Pythium insidiosum]
MAVRPTKQLACARLTPRPRSIAGWKQIVGEDCSKSSDAAVLLKEALKTQPIAVAINSADPFKDYKGDFYSCPNQGNLASKDDVNHALLLVGYGTDARVGDYWILKNSYGSEWGEKGFMKLIADKKLNCGLAIFPVVPLGANATATSALVVDGGGKNTLLGLSPTSWIVVAVVVSLVTIVATIGGVIYTRRRLQAIREQVTGATPYDRGTSVRFN